MVVQAAACEVQDKDEQQSKDDCMNPDDASPS